MMKGGEVTISSKTVVLINVFAAGLPGLISLRIPAGLLGVQPLSTCCACWRGSPLANTTYFMIF